MSLLDKIFGTGTNPADAATPYLNNIPGIGHETYDPYVTTGKKAGGITQDMYEQLISDPQGFINKLMEGYKPSEGYQFAKDELTSSLGNTAAAGGIAGTPLDQMNQGKEVQKLLSKDQQQYLENALGIFKTGLTGEEGVATRGFDAAKALGDLLGNNQATQAGLAFQGQSQQNANKNSLIQGILKALGGAAGFATQPALSIFGNKVWG
jgi:hypothetical protein